MEITQQQIIELAKIQAQMVINKLHRYALTYQEPESIDAGLLESMGEELTAGDWYDRRAAMCRLLGDEETARGYERIRGDEINDHYLWFSQRLEARRKQEQLQGVDGTLAQV